MKQTWQRISLRIDSMTLRERVMVFAAAAGVVIFLVFLLFLNPSYAKHKLLLDEMVRQQDRIAAVEADMARTIEAHTLDPDAAERARLAKIQAEAQALKTSLMTMQQGMVPAERMNGLLEQILRSHRGLRLRSMRTLGEIAPEPAEAAVAAPTASAAAKSVAPQLLHRHGVELVLQGSYLDMVAYMSALESMQGQILWGGATMAVEAYPSATLTLTLYTINLDKKWLKL